MKTRWILGLLLTGVAAAVFLVAVQQRQATAAMSEEIRALRSEAAAQAASPALSWQAAPPTSAVPLTPAERIELMELRDRVTTLRERQRTLKTISNENAHLRAQWAALTHRAGSDGARGEVEPFARGRSEGDRRGRRRAPVRRRLWRQQLGQVAANRRSLAF